MDREDVQTLSNAILRHCKLSVLAKEELSGSTKASGMKESEGNLKIPPKDQVRSFIWPVDAWQIHELGLEEYGHLAFESIIQVCGILMLLNFLLCFC